MLKLKHFIIFIIISFSNFIWSYGCTSVIITGKMTADGRPLLLKQRDGENSFDCIDFFKGEKYDFIGLIDGNYQGGDKVVCGTNSAGFCIINTATYNLGKRIGIPPSIIMHEALSKCKNLHEFEIYLMTIHDTIMPANFGIIDAEGGAAYYEISYTSWTKFDANDTSVAPSGFLIYTNFSFSGDSKKKRGYVRYLTTLSIISETIHTHNITAKWIFDNVSRSFRNEFMGIDLKDEKYTPKGYFPDQNFIPNFYTSASVVFQGVKHNESPKNTIMWTILGYPPIGFIVPLTVDEKIPFFMLRNAISKNSLMYELSSSLKKQVFKVDIGDGKPYFDFSKIYSKNNIGYMQEILAIEENYYDVFCKFIIQKHQQNRHEYLDKFYNSYFQQINLFYSSKNIKIIR